MLELWRNVKGFEGYYESCTDAANAIGKNSHSMVSAVCRGDSNSYYGFKWIFANFQDQKKYRNRNPIYRRLC